MALEDFPTEAELAASAVAPRHTPANVPEAPASEDLFDFPILVAFAEGEATEARAERDFLLVEDDGRGDLGGADDLFDAPELEGSIDAATRSVTQLLAEVPEHASRTAQPAAKPKARQRSTDVIELDLRGAHRRASERAAASTAPVVVAGPSRPMWILVAAALLLNLGVFAFLWQTTRAFQQTLVEVRAERSQPVPPPALPVVSQGMREGEPSGVPDRRLQPPTGIEPAEEIALRLAREELAGARPVEARRRLFALLATVDGLERTRREHVEARASFLVAETFRAQALAAQGGRP